MMPTITVEGPPITDLDRKRSLAKEMTDAASKAYSLPRGVIVVVIKENAPDNVSVGGQLIIDRAKAESGTG
jgi:4-oxalocrotonate tautomerase